MFARVHEKSVISISSIYLIDYKCFFYNYFFVFKAQLDSIFWVGAFIPAPTESVSSLEILYLIVSLTYRREPVFRWCISFFSHFIMGSILLQVFVQFLVDDRTYVVLHRYNSTDTWASFDYLQTRLKIFWDPLLVNGMFSKFPKPWVKYR